MPPRPITGPDPAALAALQAESEQALRKLLDELKARAATLGDAPSGDQLAAVLRDVGALRERLQHDQRMGRLSRGAARSLARDVDDLGRNAQQQRRERGRKLADEREARAAHTLALPAAIQEFTAAVEAYDPLEKGRERADAVQVARQRVQELLEAGADPSRSRDAMGRLDEARRTLGAKYKQREAVARDNEALVEGLVLGFRRATAEVAIDSPKELLAVASTARRKVVDAFRASLLPREIRARLQALFDPPDRRHKEILDARHRAYLERKERRERLDREREERKERAERERRERKAEREREFLRVEAKLLHYAAAYCSRVYAYDPAEAPRGEAAKVRLSRRPFDEILRARVCRPSKIHRVVDAVRAAAVAFEDILEERRKLFVRDGHAAEETGKPQAPPPEAIPEPVDDSAAVDSQPAAPDEVHAAPPAPDEPDASHPPVPDEPVAASPALEPPAPDEVPT
jgi:hypothetical protein